MTKKVIRRKRRKEPATPWQPMPERAPSITREEQPTFTRLIALLGLVLIALGASALAAPLFQRQHAFISATWGFIMFTSGIYCIVVHALSERDIQFRRTYGFIGMMLMVFGLLLRVVHSQGVWGGLFLPFGVPCLAAAFVFIIAYLRFEDDHFWKWLGLGSLGGAGALMILIGLGFGNFNPDFLQGQGIVFCVLGLIYACGFIAMLEPGSDHGYYAGLALGGVGLITLVVASVRSFFAPDFLVPDGFVLSAVGLIYLIISAGICLDWSIIVLTRRELASLFYSPIAYLVLIGFMLVGWFMFWSFVNYIDFASSQPGQVLFEPIVGRYILAFIPIVGLMFVVPVLTMRLLSEEKRSGTLEVLLTAPVTETPIVLSKFFAVLFYFLLAWLPWGLFLVSLRVVGGEPFDYRPLLSFFIALTVTGSGFLSMGLFFSSVTRNQIVAAVFTFVGMMAHVALYILSGFLTPGTWVDILRYISFLDLWDDSLNGLLAPRYMVFHVTATIFFLFATIKVLDSRRWN